MQPAQRALAGMIEIFLHERCIDATVGKNACLPGLHEEATRVLVHGWDNLDNAGQHCGFELYRQTA